MLSDVDHVVGRSYEVERAPGEQYDQFPRRVAYLIDPSGTIARSYDVSDVAGFATQVLGDIAQLQEDPPT